MPLSDAALRLAVSGTSRATLRRAGFRFSNADFAAVKVRQLRAGQKAINTVIKSGIKSNRPISSQFQIPAFRDLSKQFLYRARIVTRTPSGDQSFPAEFGFDRELTAKQIRQRFRDIGQKAINQDRSVQGSPKLTAQGVVTPTSIKRIDLLPVLVSS